MDKPNYYAIIPADVRYDNELKDKSKLLYGEIVALSNKDGVCFANNKYFADLYGVSNTTISLLIKELVDKGYLESEITYKENTKEIDHRYLRILKGGYLRNLKGGIKENLKDNNTSININNNIYNYYENIFARTLNPIEYETMTKWLEKKSEDEIIKAINEAGKANIDNIRYIEKILFSKKRKGTPEWFNKEIESSGTEEDIDFKNFITDFRNR